MPEVVIILVIICVLIWLGIAVLMMIGRAFQATIAALEKASAARTAQRYLRNKTKVSQYTRVVLPSQLDWAQKKLALAELELKQAQQRASWLAHPPSPPAWKNVEFQPYLPQTSCHSAQEMDAEEVQTILLPNSTLWLEEESRLIAQSCQYPHRPPAHNSGDLKEHPLIALNLAEAVFEWDATKTTKKAIDRYFAKEQGDVAKYNHERSALLDRRDALNGDITAWNAKASDQFKTYLVQSAVLTEKELSKFDHARTRYSENCKTEQAYFKKMALGYRNGLKSEVINRVNFLLRTISLPRSVPRSWDVDFDEEQCILIIEMELPDVVHRPPFKKVTLKGGQITKPLNQKEKREIVPQIHPAIILRIAFEVCRNDDARLITLLVINGWVQFDDPRTGVNTKAYTASLMADREQIASLNLEKLEPLVAFQTLHGKSAGKLVEIVPIEPALCLNKKDSRFVDAKEILSTLGSASNLASMDWQDFEHLIRELFEKEFAGRGTEVKITQASRDRGVDAIAFDPDPIRGGKFVIQAKRYTNTVDVSAVRDLCAVVKKEGASRGILVTTSTYGADAYAFANNEPVTLLTGAELLGLLKKHGYTFRIDLQEARKESSAASSLDRKSN